MKMKEKEALEIAKKSDDEKELETLVDNMDLSKKVRLEVAKRKDSTAYYAKLTLTDKMFTEDDILYMLIDDKNKNVSERAFTALCERMKGAGIKDKDVREDFIEYVIDVAEKTKMKDRRITNYLLEKCLKATNYAIIRTELEKLLAKMNESQVSHLLEALYIQLAQQTSSQSQLQKLSESQFESVREIANKRLI